MAVVELAMPVFLFERVNNGCVRICNAVGLVVQVNDGCVRIECSFIGFSCESV